MSNLLLIAASAITGALGLWVGYTALYEGRLDSPKYSVLSSEKNFEVRDYEPFTVASTALQEQGQGQLSNGFRILAGYIFGGNDKGESLAMTAPVLQQNGVNTGLLASASEQGMTMAFVMPLERAAETIPRPNSARIELQPVEWGRVASIRFSGRASEDDFRAAEAQLRSWLEGKSLSPVGAAAYAQYNSPSAFPALRRNEVLIKINSSEL